MYDARGIANYFIDRAFQRGATITVMTLLKVLYFAHAWHLVKFGRPLVAQPFEAWKYGPVNRVVYDQLKELGKKPIQNKLKSFNIDICEFVETPFACDKEINNFLNNIFDYYSQFHPFQLSDLTHESGSPWDVVWKTAERQAVPGMIIPDSLIIKWFQRSGDVQRSSVQ
jgi:uncharacterized phage-associated protein